MKLHTHALSIAAMTASCCVVSGMVFADGLKSQWKTRQPISNSVTDVKTDMTQFDAFELQKRIDALNASDLAKLVVNEGARLAVRKGNKIAQTMQAIEKPTPVVDQSFGEVDRLRSVKKNAKTIACANMHTRERAECLSKEAYRKTNQYKAVSKSQTAFNAQR